MGLGSNMTNLSIITNFGCAADCWYCIWKTHPLRSCWQTANSTDWEKLEGFIKANQQQGKISISGGGDPLYRFAQLTDWWDRLCVSWFMDKCWVEIRT